MLNGAAELLCALRCAPSEHAVAAAHERGCKVLTAAVIAGVLTRPAWPASAEASTCAAILHHFKEPVMVVEGKQQYLFDERGRRYLDVRRFLTAL